MFLKMQNKESVSQANVIMCKIFDYWESERVKAELWASSAFLEAVEREVGLYSSCQNSHKTFLFLKYNTVL